MTKVITNTDIDFVTVTGTQGENQGAVIMLNIHLKSGEIIEASTYYSVANESTDYLVELANDAIEEAEAEANEELFDKARTDIHWMTEEQRRDFAHHILES